MARVVLERAPLPRSRLAAMCWDEVPQATANANLRSVLSDLRKVAPGLLSITRDTVAPGADAAASVDVARFLAELEQGVEDRTASPEERIARCRSALRSASGDFLADLDPLVGEDLARWIESERRFLHGRVIDVLGVLVAMLRQSSRPSEAVAAARELVAMDPYREQSHVALVESLVDAGERHAALRELDRCRALLVDDLGIALSPSTVELEDRIRGEAGLTVVLDLLPLPERPVLFGREAILPDLVALDRSAGVPLITLRGAAGVGKTSIAVELAHRWRSAGHDVVFVDLTEIDRHDALAEAIARSLGSSVAADTRVVGDLVGDRDLRLVLDNFEHLDAAASSVVVELLDTCPALTVVITSRLPLDVRAETVIVVEPLPVPSSSASSQELDDAVAVRLFQHTARRRGGTAESTDTGAVAHLCRLLGGLPLALELAASQVRAVGLDTMIDHIESADLSLLESDLSDVPDRHRTLDLAIADSLRSIDAAGRRIFASAAVFSGPFSAEAMEVVASIETTGTGLHRLLQSLVDLQLLRRQDREGTTWYSLLPALHGVATGLLEWSGRHDESIRRRVDHDAALILRASDEFQSAASRRWYRYLDAYQATIRDTLDRLHETADAREAEAVAALGEYWLDRGQFGEGAKRLARCPVPPDGATMGWLAPSLRMWEVILRAEAVGYAASEDVVEVVVECLERIRATAPMAPQLASMQLACHAFDLAGRADLAAPLLDEGLDLAEQTGEVWIAIELRYAKAMIAHVAGDDALAARLLRRVLADSELHSSPRMEMYAHMLSALIGVAGPAGGTEWSLLDLLDRAVELGDRRQVIWMLVSLGAVAFMEGDNQAAARWAQEALTLSQNGGYYLGARYCLMSGMSLSMARGDLASAIEFHGAIESDLEHIERTMPRAYFEPYLEMVAVLDAAEADDLSLAVARRRGAESPERRTLARLAEHFATFA